MKDTVAPIRQEGISNEERSLLAPMRVQREGRGQLEPQAWLHPRSPLGHIRTRFGFCTAGGLVTPAEP